jgi:hypothetical protein
VGLEFLSEQISPLENNNLQLTADVSDDRDQNSFIVFSLRG